MFRGEEGEGESTDLSLDDVDFCGLVELLCEPSSVVLGLREFGGEEGVDEGRLSESRLAWGGGKGREEGGRGKGKERRKFSLSCSWRRRGLESSGRNVGKTKDELLTYYHQGKVLGRKKERGKVSPRSSSLSASGELANDSFSLRASGKRDVDTHSSSLGHDLVPLIRQAESCA